MNNLKIIGCIECGIGPMRLKTARTSHEVCGVNFEVEGKVLVCAHCGFQMIPCQLLNEHARLVEQGYRKAAGPGMLKRKNARSFDAPVEAAAELENALF